MVSFTTAATRQPWWVQTALNALNSPSAGWVTTIFSLGKILPPPTGMSDVLAIASPEPVLPVSPPVEPESAGSDEDPLSDPAPQAARTAPAPTAAAPPITARRVVWSVMEPAMLVPSLGRIVTGSTTLRGDQFPSEHWGEEPSGVARRVRGDVLGRALGHQQATSAAALGSH